MNHYRSFFASLTLAASFLIPTLASASVIYNAVPSPLPPNAPSQPFQAQQTSEFGDYIHLGGTDRILTTVTVGMSDWALEATPANVTFCTANPSLCPTGGFVHPITINIYSNHLGSNGVPDTLLATKTQDITVPWRPVADPTCTDTTQWKGSDNNCYSGLAFNAVFDLSSLNVTLPNDIIVGIAYNTQTYGSAPIGVDGPYNSLNVLVPSSQPVTVGTDDNVDQVFWNTSTASDYSDGGTAGVGIFRKDTNWTPNGTVSLLINANSPTPTTVKVTIDKFIDDSAASSTSATASFPMSATWNAANIGAGTGTFTLSPTGFNSPNPYEAITSDMSSGASYTASEVTGGTVVGTDCTGSNPYALVGYSSGDTLALAQASTTSPTAPSFTNLTSDKVVIVRNKTCPVVAPQPQVHIFKNVDGAQATAASSGSATFPMETTFDSPNLGVATNAPFTLSPTGWGATDSAYEASFVGSNAGANYEADEVLGGPVVGDACDGTHTFSLVGYTTGDTLAEAQAGTPALTPLPNFTNLQSDKYVIVWNKTCPTTGSVTIEKDSIGGNGTFNFTSDIPGHTSFSITTVSGVGSQTFTGVTPATYHVTEATQLGWTLTDNTECSAVVVTASGAPICHVTNTMNTKLGEIRGTKYEDRDGDGKLKDGDHHRLSGWTIYLDTNNNGVLNSGEPSTITDSHGEYRFLSLPAGTYHVREVGQTGWVQTYPSTSKYDITLGAGQIAKKKDFGNFHLGTISGIKFNDANGNGRKDNGEVGLAGWTIKLKGPGSNGSSVSMTTGANGAYSFTGLSAGTYTLSEVAQTGWHQTLHPASIKIQSGTNATKANFGNTQRPLDSDGDYDGSPPDGHSNNNRGH